MCFNKDQTSMLLYLETCIVDNFGFAKGVSMNVTDIEIAKKWDDEGFLVFKRVPYDYLKETERSNTHYVRFSDEAWKLAHKLRRERAERMTKKHPVERIESYRRKR